MPRMVQCVKLGKELEGLPRPPFNGELAKRIFESVSKEAWNMWLAHARILINEYRLNMASAQAQELLLKEMERYFFGEGSDLPPEFVPPKPE
jgi:Fe-S cluster biosynthesis and repair protein YggX